MSMSKLKFEMYIKEKPGFNENELENSINKSLEEIKGRLLEFYYDHRDYKCVCMVSIESIPSGTGILDYQMIFGGIQQLSHEDYPFFEIVGIPQDKIEYEKLN